MADTPRGQRWMLAILATHTVLLVGLVVALVVLVTRPAPPAPVQGPPGDLAAPDRAGGPPPGGDAGPEPWKDFDKPLKAYFFGLVGPLKQAAVEAGDDPDEVLPPEAEIEAAVDSGALDSEAAKAVLARLREGYARYDLPFPVLTFER